MDYTLACRLLDAVKALTEGDIKFLGLEDAVARCYRTAASTAAQRTLDALTKELKL